MLEHSHPRSSRGVSGDDPEGGAGSGVLRRAARNRLPREARDPARQALRSGCEELAARIRVMPETEARPRVKNRHGGAPRGERPASWDARRLARRLTCRVMARPTGAEAPERLSALRPPLDSGERSKVAKPRAQKRAAGTG